MGAGCLRRLYRSCSDVQKNKNKPTVLQGLRSLLLCPSALRRAHFKGGGCSTSEGLLGPDGWRRPDVPCQPAAWGPGEHKEARGPLCTGHGQPRRDLPDGRVWAGRRGGVRLCPRPESHAQGPRTRLWNSSSLNKHHPRCRVLKAGPRHGPFSSLVCFPIFKN